MSMNTSFAPSRRRFCSLLAAGAAVALPKLPAIAAPAEPDAVLIAHSHVVARVVERAEAAWRRAARAEARSMSERPSAPTFTCCGRTFPEYPASELRKDIEEALAIEGEEPDGFWIMGRRERLARMEAYETECDRLDRRFRVDAAAQVALRADARLNEAVVQLTFMPPTTPAGLAAKARASMGLLDQIGTDHAIDALVEMIVREAVMIGGAA